MGDVYCIRHGETEWSRAMRHTGRTDIPLTERGREEAAALAPALKGRRFARVLVSPLSRATETAEIAGLGESAERREELVEWDYGDYEGATTAQIRDGRPGWVLWQDGCPGGETATDVGARVDPVISELSGLKGDAAVVAHGHLLRVFAARWLGFEPADGSRFALSTARISILGHEHEWRALRAWNSLPRAV